MVTTETQRKRRFDELFGVGFPLCLYFSVVSIDEDDAEPEIYMRRSKKKRSSNVIDMKAENSG
jgi:hypothetical protein